MAPHALLPLLACVFLRVAAEPECKTLVRPLILDSHSPIYGRWVLNVASWDREELKDDLFSVKASLVELSSHPDNEHLTLYWADRMRKDDTCLQGLTNATISGMTTHTTFNIKGHTSYHDGKYYETCADCLLSEDTTLLPDGNTKGRYLLLFTRTGTLDSSELETFKKQAECLNFLPEYFFGTNDLCPDQRKTESSAAESDSATTQAPSMESN